MKRRLLLMVGLWVLSSAIPGQALGAGEADGGAEGPRTESPYVGAQVCAGCHQAEAADWHGSDHDLAMQPASPATVLGDFNDATFDYFGIVSTFFRKNDTFYVRTDNANGTLADFPIAYTFGVYPLQQYLIELPGGRLQALSIVWDTRLENEGGQRWYHLYPEEPIRAGDELHWTGLNQNWNFMCADCHSTNLQKNYDLDADSYATTWSEIDVGCEACHGPGKSHVDAVNAGETRPHGGFRVSLSRAEAKAWTTNPKTGSPYPGMHGPEAQPELEVCAQCHSRRTTQFHGARPADGLFDHFMPALLDEGLYHADGQIDGEVYVYGSFLQSRMYQAGVTCSDCHNPHSLALKAKGNALCAQCHVPARYDTETHHGHPSGSTGAQCVNCHMPEKTYMGVDDRRDHSFRIPRPDLSVSLGVPNTCSQCHTDRSPDWAAQVLAKRNGPPPAGHYAEALHAGRYGGDQAAQLLSDLILDTTQPSIARATAITLLPPYLSNQSAGVLQQVSRTDDPLMAIGVAQALDGIPQQYRPIFGLPSLYDDHRVIRGLAASRLAPSTIPTTPAEVATRYGEAMDSYIESQLYNADRPESLVNLGDVSWQRGEMDQAEDYYRLAMHRAPFYTPAYVNLADFLRYKGDDAAGKQVLESALTAVRDATPIHHALGLLLVRQKRLSEGLPHLRLAAESPSAPARYVYVYAVALHSTGDPGAAIAELEQGLQRFPGNPEILSGLVSFLRSEGKNARADGYQRQLQQP